MDLPKLHTALRNARAEVIEARYANDQDGNKQAYEALMIREARLTRLISIVKHAYKKSRLQKVGP